ncbi:PstS family phosphate ABC transporter substrate-binding protein [Marinococcus luteus]|uniref:PstS family phosphate ABC transporter substrate-binding protein n=1 Tax=Marinococcus luteus TaxID=1122204 RepID=UPI002ACCAC81|nr:PstS family phosphate ABC transporter substrate-binding protein [Marinococcus luteus]MDZ5783708.1 PstS family phosphate ABC transporter substrate-binding protein [Marinococcus luteus]
MKLKTVWMVPTLASMAVFASACGGGGEEPGGGGESGSGEESGGESAGQEGGGSGDIAIDGSSTVFPIMEAVSEEFGNEYEDIEAPVGVSGSGGGFERFIEGETDLNNASREISEEEQEALEEEDIEYTELIMAYDGITVAVNPENDFVDELTYDELEQIYSDDSDAETWSDINEEWPDEELDLYAPGTDSGTHDYFVENVLGGADLTRNASTSEDDNTLVNGVAGSESALGFFGYSYYVENEDDLKAVPITDDDEEAVEPSLETINDESYPLARPLFTYFKNSSVEDDEDVEEYVRFANENAGELAEEVGYAAAPDSVYEENEEKIDEVAGE